MRSHARFHVVSAVGAVLAVVGCTLVSAGSPADPSVLVAAGRVLDSSGLPVEGLEVAALLEPTDEQENAAQPGQDFPLVPIARTVTDAEGSWQLEADDVHALPRDADGTIPVLVWGSDERGAVMRTISLQAPFGGVLQVSEEDVATDAEQVVSAPQEPAQVRQLIRSAAVTSGAGGQVVPAEAQVLSTVEEGKGGKAELTMVMGPPTSSDPGAGGLPTDSLGPRPGAQVLASPTAPCPAGALVGYRLTSRYQDRPVALASAYSAGKTKSTFQYATTTGSSFQVGVTYGGSVGGVSGTQKASQSTTTGVSINGIANAGRHYNITFRFREWNIWCTTNVRVNPQHKFSGYSQWRPYKWTGGNSFTNWVPFTCKAAYKASLTASSFWVSRNETVTRTGAFTISGGGLSATQVYSSGNNVKLTYKKVSTSSTATYNLCGNNDVPAAASLVRES